MDLSPKSFVTIDQILSDVLKTVGDSDFKLNSKGWYTSQIQQALEELSFDTFFNEYNSSYDVPSDLRLELPEGAFNIRQIFLFNGDDCDCTIEKRANVWFKRNFINGEGGRGFVARNTYSNDNDVFHGKGPSKIPSNLHFYSIQNGMIMLSENCLNYKRIMLVYNGVSCNIGDVPVVPIFFRQAVKDWVLVKALEIKASDVAGTNMYSHWAGMLNRVDNSLNKPYDGSWAKAEYRSKQLNHKERQDIKEYFLRMNY